MVLIFTLAIIFCIFYILYNLVKNHMVLVITLAIIFCIFYILYKLAKNHSGSQHYSNKFSKKKGQYPQIIKSTSHKDNMNCTLYTFSGKYSETNRIRKNKTVYVFSNENPLDAIKNMGYSDPIEYVKSDFPSPSEAQMRYLFDLTHGHIPNNVSHEDASALIGRYVEEDNKVPNPDLFHFAEQMHIPVSYYCGKKRLYNLIFNDLQIQDRIAFFIFQVYRYSYTDYSIANMNNSPYKHLFYEFANSKIYDESFIKSLNRYSGESLRIFGAYGGGSKNTIAYKEARAFLQEHTKYS